MRKRTGNNTETWGFDAIFDVTCPRRGHLVEFFKDEIRRTCPSCRQPVHNDRKDFGCEQWCSSASYHMRNFCPKFRKSKSRYWGHKI